MNKLYIFIGVVSFLASLLSVNAVCNECQENGVACLNRTSFQVCFGGCKAYFKQTFTCLDGMECTDLPSICFQTGGWAPSCGDLSKCGVCNVNRVFACTSRTTFKFCFGAATPSDVKGFCPSGYVCDLTAKSICVPHGTGVEPSCDILEEIQIPEKSFKPVIVNNATMD